MSDYFVGHGKVYAAQRDVDGDPTGFLDLGNCPSFVLTPGNRGLRDVTNPEVLPGMFPAGVTGSIRLVLDELNANNLSQAFYGSNIAVTENSVVGETVKAYTGKFCPTQYINISSVTVSGKVEGTDYTVDPAGGLHVIQVGTSEGESWSVSYDYSDQNVSAAFSLAPELLWIRFNGINIAEDNAPVVVDVYKVRFVPVDDVQLIGDTFLSMTLNGKIQYDSTKDGTTLWGNYFRIRSA